MQHLRLVVGHSAVHALLSLEGGFFVALLLFAGGFQLLDAEVCVDYAGGGLVELLDWGNFAVEDVGLLL